MVQLRRLFKVRPGEGTPVLILFWYYFFVMATNLVGRSARDAYFLSRYDDEALPLVMLMVPIVATITIGFYTRISNRIGLVPIVAGSGIFFAGSLIAIQFSLTRELVAFLYVWIEVIGTVIFFQFWLLAGTVFDTRQAKRLFGVIGAGGAVGSIIFGLGLQPFVDTYGSDNLLLLGASLMVLWVLMALLVRPYVKRAERKNDRNETNVETDGPIFTRYLRTIVVVIGVTIFVATIIDYQFKIIAKDHYNNSEAELARFFGLFYAVVGFLSLFMRLFLVSRILGGLGILFALLILPTTVSIGSIAILISPLLFSAVLTKGADQVFRYTVNEAATELSWVPISAFRRLRAKPIVNGTITSILQGAAALTIFFGVAALAIGVEYLSVVVLALIAVWLPAVFQLRTGYVSELLRSIERRELKFEDLTLDITDNTMVANIREGLLSKDEIEQAFMLELIADLNIGTWRVELRHMMQEGSYPIKQKILLLAAENRDIISDDEVMAIIKSGSDLTDEALVIAARRNIRELVPLLHQYLRDDRIEIQAAAAKATLVMKQGPVDEARHLFEHMLQQSDTLINTLALNMLVDMPDEFPADLMSRYLHRNTTQILSLSLQVAQQLQSQEMGLEIADVVHNLRKPRTAMLARRVLANYDDERVKDVLLTLYRAPNIDRQLRIGITQTLKDYANPEIIELLVEQLDESDIVIYAESVNALLEIARLKGLPQDILDELDLQNRRISRFIYARYQMLDFFEDPESEMLLVDLIQEDVDAAIPVLLKLSVMDLPHTPIETVIYNLQFGNSSNKIANVLEIMDNIFSREEREVIIPIFDDMSPRERSQIGMRHYHDLPRNLDDEVSRFIHQSADPWRVTVALDYALRNQRHAIIAEADWKSLLRERSVKALVTRFLSNDGTLLRDLDGFPIHIFPQRIRLMTMYSTLEKTIMLKSAKIFQNISARDISHLAQIAKEIQLKSGDTLFEVGDSGDSMYIVASGEVRVHKDNVEIARLGKGSVIGEMALLDLEPRSASVTATEKTFLLKIERVDFYELMASRIEIMQGIIKMLTSRLRTTLKVTTTDGGKLGIF